MQPPRGTRYERTWIDDAADIIEAALDWLVGFVLPLVVVALFVIGLLGSGAFLGNG